NAAGSLPARASADGSVLGCAPIWSATRIGAAKSPGISAARRRKAMKPPEEAPMTTTGRAGIRVGHPPRVPFRRLLSLFWLRARRPHVPPIEGRLPRLAAVLRYAPMLAHGAVGVRRPRDLVQLLRILLSGDVAIGHRHGAVAKGAFEEQQRSARIHPRLVPH